MYNNLSEVTYRACKTKAMYFPPGSGETLQKEKSLSLSIKCTPTLIFFVFNNVRLITE